jgi:hypothetical protein
MRFIAAVLLATAMPVFAGPHEHGVLRLDVTVEARKLTIRLESPLDNLVGFERAPRTDDERQRVEAAVARLKAADSLFTIDPAARCKLKAVELTSAALQLGNAKAPDADGHAEVEAVIDFDCEDGRRTGFVDVALFDAFARLRRIEAQAIVAKGQLKATLKRPARRIALAR